MKYYGISFFSETPIYAHISKSKEEYDSWPITIKINRHISSKHSNPDITIYLEKPEYLIAFKNSVIAACNKALNAKK